MEREKKKTNKKPINKTRKRDHHDIIIDVFTVRNVLKSAMKCHKAKKKQQPRTREYGSREKRLKASKRSISSIMKSKKGANRTKRTTDTS